MLVSRVTARLCHCSSPFVLQYRCSSLQVFRALWNSFTEAGSWPVSSLTEKRGFFRPSSCEVQNFDSCLNRIVAFTSLALKMAQRLGLFGLVWWS